MRSSRPARADRCLVALATYNEIENIESLVGQILQADPNWRVLVVDDNSPDGTGTWCQEFSRRSDRFDCIIRDGKMGLGSAVLAKFQYAQQHNFEILLTMDADHSHDVSEAARLLAASSEADVVIGSRYVPGGTIAQWPASRRLASRLANRFARSILGIQAHDCSSGFRCYRVDCLRHLPADVIVSTGYSFYEEILWRLQREGAKIAEVPISFTDRVHGLSKANVREVLVSAVQLAQMRWRG